MSQFGPKVASRYCPWCGAPMTFITFPSGSVTVFCDGIRARVDGDRLAVTYHLGLLHLEGFGPSEGAAA